MTLSAPEEPLAFPIENRNSKLENQQRRRRGPPSKIARLPVELRALLNQLLDQDKTYDEVVEEMAKQGVQLNTDNVSRWFNGPYHDYLAALDWQDELQQLRDHAFSFGQEEGNVRFQEGLVQIGLTQLFRAMKEDRFKDDPANHLRLFNSLARLSREALVIRKYADQQAKERIAQLARRRPSSPSPSLAAPKSDEGGSTHSRRRGDESLINEAPAATESPVVAAAIRPPEPAIPSATNPPIQHSNNPISGDPPTPDQSAPSTNISRCEPSTFNLPSSEALLAKEDQPSITPETTNHELVAPTCPATASERRRKSDEGGPPTTDSSHASRITHHDSELCHYCRKYLPPRLPNGQRPFTHCQLCGTALRPLELLHLYCPECGCRLDSIYENGRRTASECPHCLVTLPATAAVTANAA